jgi:hypothetical protein
MPLDPPRQSIDYGQPRLDGGTVLGEDRAGNRGCEDDAPAFLQTDEGVSPDRIVRGTTRPGDCGQPAAIGEPRQGRRDMAQGGVGHAAIDVRDGREWRVHQHDVWCDTDVEMIVDVCGVEARHRGAGKEERKKSSAGFGELVENERRARQLGQDGEQARAGRRLQHYVGRGDRGRGTRRKPKYDRCAELLKRFALFRAARVGWKKARELGQHRQHRSRRSRAHTHGRTELANEQDCRCLAGVVGCLPIPSAISVGGAKGAFHRSAQHRRIDALAALEMPNKKLRRLGNGSGLRHRTGCNGKRRDRISGHGDGSRCHGENLERAGEGSNRGVLSRPRRLKPVPARLSLSKLDEADDVTSALISARAT